MASPTATDGKLPGQEMSNNGPGIVLCWCPAGTYRMGSDDVFDTLEMAFVPPDRVASRGWSPQRSEGSVEDDEFAEGDDDDDPTSYWACFHDETPAEVTLSHGFWIGKYPVTQSEYEVVMGPGSHSSRFLGRDDSARRPVERISWDDAAMFCRELTGLERAAGRLPEGWAYRIPTEAQWEYACRAGTRTRYYSGDGEDDLERAAFFRTRASRYDREARQGEQTHAVGRKEPNAWGLHDTLGNVNEWCRDAYQEALPGGPDPVVLPAKRDDCRVVRGGNYHASAEQCRVSSRQRWDPDTRHAPVGFRVALVRIDEAGPIDPRERSAESPFFDRRKAAVEGRPIPRPPETYEEIQARIEAFLAKPDLSGKGSPFYEMADEILRSYLVDEFPQDQAEVRGLLVLAISGIQGDLKYLNGDPEDHMMEREALCRGMYHLLYAEDPEAYQHPNGE